MDGVETQEDTYGHVHRALLQAFMARSQLTFEEAQPIMAALLSLRDDRAVLPNDVVIQDFRDWVNKINEAISPLDYTIRQTRHQDENSNERIWVFVNMTSDPLTQMATTHSADDIAFVKRVLDAMFVSNNTQRSEVMAVTGMEALKLHKPPKERNRDRESMATQANGDTETQAETQGSAGAAISVSHAEEVLVTLVNEGWFEKSRKGYYSLTPRALVELKVWLVETYNEPPEEGEEEWQRIKFCEACRDVVTIGQRCPNRDCLTRLHDYCMQSFFRTQQGRCICPKCGSEWTGNDFVGEKATTAGAGRRGIVASTRRTTMDTVNGSEDEDEHEYDE